MAHESRWSGMPTLALVATAASAVAHAAIRRGLAGRHTQLAAAESSPRPLRGTTSSAH